MRNCDDHHPVSAAKFAEDETIAYQSVNPYDDKILKTFEQLTDEQLETALEIAETCLETRRHTTFAIERS